MKSKISDYITINKLRELFELRGPDVVWKNPRAPQIKTGQVAGGIQPDTNTAYRRVGVKCSDGKVHLFLAHHIAFALHNNRWATSILDHRDGDGLNNHPGNIREATGSKNNMNTRVGKNSRTGVKGVKYIPSLPKPYNACIREGGKPLHNTFHTTLEEATQAVREARTKHHGEFARHD